MDDLELRASELMLADQKVADMACEFTSVSQEAKGMAEVDAFLDARLRDYGIDNFIIVQALDRSKHPTGMLMHGRSCEPWRKHYLKHRLAAKDELMRKGRYEQSFVTWSMFQERGEVSADQQNLFDQAGEFGLRDGFYLPLPQLDGSLFAVAMLAQRKLERRGRLLPMLHLMGIYYHLAVVRLISQTKEYLTLPGEKPIALTRRQAECLQWVRAGKTDWEISQILGLSEHTVIEHLDEARKRLGVKTRTQAVINAIHFGLIQV